MLSQQSRQLYPCLLGGLEIDQSSAMYVSWQRTQHMPPTGVLILKDVHVMTLAETQLVLRCLKQTRCACHHRFAPLQRWFAVLPPRRFLNVWTADTYLQETYDLLIGSHGSICSLIQHSPAISSIFHKHLRELCPGTKLHNLSSAPHRFNSVQVPLSRFVRFLPAVLATACEISVSRRGSEPGPDV